MDVGVFIYVFMIIPIYKIKFADIAVNQNGNDYQKKK